MNVHSVPMETQEKLTKSTGNGKVTDKKEAIFEATLNLIMEHGFHGTPMSMIATEAKVGAGTIYRYFENKEQLLNALFKELKHRMNTVIFSSFSYNLSGFDLFHSLYSNMIKYYIERPHEFKFLEKYSNSPFLTEQTLDESSMKLEPIIGLLETVEMNFKLREMPWRMIFAHVYGPMIAVVNLKLIDKVELDDKEIMISAKACWAGITE